MQKIIFFIHLLGLCFALQAVAIEAPHVHPPTLSALTTMHAIVSPSADDTLNQSVLQSYTDCNVLETSEVDEDFLLLNLHHFQTPQHRHLQVSHLPTRSSSPVIYNLDRPPQNFLLVLI